MKVISADDLERLTEEARSAERLRRNLNLHDSYDDTCQRLFNAIEPGTYIRPHRHTTPPKSETFVIMRGALAIVTFDDTGTPVQSIELNAAGSNLAADLAPGIWHMILSLAPGTVFFEAKPGPYTPLSDKDFAPWSPREGSPASCTFLQEVLSSCACSVAGEGGAHA